MITRQRPMTIDLKAIYAEEYLQSKKTYMKVLIEKIIKYTAISGIIWFLIVILVGWGILSPKEVNATYEGRITYEKMLSSSTVKPPFIIYSRLKDQCYAQNVNDKWHCIKTGLSIAYAESSWKNINTPFGLKSYEKGYKKWVKSYNRYWYPATNGFYFYGDWGQYGPSHYCTEEHSSGSAYGCPNGRINFDSAYDRLNIKKEL